MKATDPDPTPEPPDSLSELQADAQRRKRLTKLVLFVAIPVAVAGIGGASWYFGEQTAEREIAEAWSHASACLIGAPLAEGERASLRARAVQLAAVHQESSHRDTDARWPNRCADYLATLYEALRQHGRDGGGEDGLGARTERLAAQLRKVEVLTDLSSQIDGLYEAASDAGLSAQPVSLQIPTPEPAAGFDLDGLPEPAQVTPLQYTLDNVSSTPEIDSEIHALVYDKKVDETPILCVFTAEGNDQCRPLGGPLEGKSGLRLGGTVDPGASPLVLAGRHGAGGVYRSDGAFEKVTEMKLQSAWVSADGYVALASYAADRDTGAFDLVTQASADAPVEKVRVEPEDVAGDATQLHRLSLMWGKLLVQTLFDDRGPPKLYAADLPPSGEGLQFTHVADVDWVNSTFFGCRTGETMAVGVGRRAGFIVFHEDGEWSSPVPVKSMSPAVGCHEGEVVFTDGAGGQRRCTPAGCKYVEGVSATFEPFEVRDLYWTNLGGNILAVASTEDRGGVRYRWADGKNLAVEGGDRLLFDDLIHDRALGDESTALGIRLAGRGNFAVNLMTTPEGVYAIRFGPDGKPEPAQIDKP